MHVRDAMDPPDRDTHQQKLTVSTSASHTAALVLHSQPQCRVFHGVKAVFKHTYGYASFPYSLAAAAGPLQVFSSHPEPHFQDTLHFSLHQGLWPVVAVSLQVEFHCPFLVGWTITHLMLVLTAFSFSFHNIVFLLIILELHTLCLGIPSTLSPNFFQIQLLFTHLQLHVLFFFFVITQ